VFLSRHGCTCSTSLPVIDIVIPVAGPRFTTKYVFKARLNAAITRSVPIAAEIK